MAQNDAKIKYYPNENVKRVLIGVPKGHKHYRLALFLGDQVLVFSEAVLANIVRAYVTVKTHPVKRSLELVCVEKPSGLKKEYARYQLLESDKGDEEIEDELKVIIEQALIQV